MMALRTWLAVPLVGIAACGAVPPSPGSARVDPPALAGTRWIGVVDASTSPANIPRLEFVQEGRLAGYTGCNLMNGLWVVEGSEVRIEQLITTKRLCVGAGDEIERRLLAALGGKSRFVREGNKLTVTGPDGQRFEFTQAAAG